MTARALFRLGAGYACALAIACLAVRAVFHLDPRRAPSSTRVVSLWRGGARFAQRIVDGEAGDTLRSECSGDCTRIVERIVDEGPLLRLPLLSIGVSIAAGREGIKAEYGERTSYLTPADLLRAQRSREGASWGKYKLRIGVDDADALLAELARGLGTDANGLRTRGRLRRFITRREDDFKGRWPRADVDQAHVSASELRRAVLAAAQYLVRNQNAEGRFVYELEATSGRELPGYSWPRHGGATLFLAEVAAYSRSPAIRRAALRGARYLQRSATVACGAQRCIGDETRVNAGSASLALLSYQALVAQGAGADLRSDLESLAAFLRSLQRPDGELMHVFDRGQGRALDVQYNYYTGEAAFALARAARITHSAADLHAASAALAHLVARPFNLVEDRYDFISHHWTCQALFELWDRAPDREALAFCLDYQQANQALQIAPGSDSDYDGGFARDPYFPPRLTPAASRAEGAAATLATAIAAGAPEHVVAAIERELRGAIAFMLRFQFLPGPTHLLADAPRMLGALPASPTDLSVRIDYPQHAAGAMLRYLQLLEAREQASH